MIHKELFISGPAEARQTNENKYPDTVFGGAQLPIMNKKYLLRTLQSFVVIPMLTSFSVPIGTVGAPQMLTFAPSGIQINSAQDKIAAQKEKVIAQEADLIDTFLESKEAPLAGKGRELALAADKYGIDYRLVTAIAFHESTAGKFACPNDPENYWGWGSCHGSQFKSLDEAIDIISMNLGGYNPKTAQYYHMGDSVEKILKTYNPPAIVPTYWKDVIHTMNAIGPSDVATLNTKLS